MAGDRSGTRSGSKNDITDVAGVRVGHHQRIGRGWMTGVTVIVPPAGTIGSSDVRGGAPGTRETDLLEPGNLVERVDAICLTGGSAYGLAAATGVADWLGERGVGYPVGPDRAHVVPIVPAAVIFDFGSGGKFANRPDASFGRAAAARASSRAVTQGCIGAGTGAHAGNLKGGVGSASVVLADGSTVAALVVVNSSGSPVAPTGELYGAPYGIGREFARRKPTRAELTAYHALPTALAPLNTTLAVVATDAQLMKQECRRLAIAGHDGMARAIRPIHQLNDGDVVFALATGARELAGGGESEPASRLAVGRAALVNPLLAAAADVVTRAITHAVLAARSLGTLTSYLDQFPSVRQVIRTTSR